MVSRKCARRWDFCRYYATRSRRDFTHPEVLPGPTGEHNQISLHGRGTFVCISPWNFPLAIFTGQIAAALAAGNSVISKPAEQTSLMAAYAVGLFHEAGVPPDVLQLLPRGRRRRGWPVSGGPAYRGGGLYRLDGSCKKKSIRPWPPKMDPSCLSSPRPVVRTR